MAGDLESLFAADTFADYNRSSGFGDGSPEGRRFRSTQFDGMRGFPQPDCSALNDLFVHPRLLEFARLALGEDDLRIYQAAVWGKWAGTINYEQPLHQDGNHSLLPPRMEPGFWHLESFLYLSDVDENCAPPRLVPRSRSTVATTTSISTRSSQPAAGDRCWHTAPTCGTAAPTSGGPTRPVRTRRCVQACRGGLVRLRRVGRRSGSTAPFAPSRRGSRPRSWPFSESPGPDTRSGTRRWSTPWPRSTPGSTSLHGGRPCAGPPSGEASGGRALRARRGRAGSARPARCAR